MEEEKKQEDDEYEYEYYSEEGETNGQFEKSEEELFSLDAKKQEDQRSAAAPAR